jgi:DNA polymerase III epsilon subunit-like protein
MANSDVMIDLETLATSPDASILTIGAVKFDPFGDELSDRAMDSFYVRVDLDSCDRIGLVTNDDTIAWWGQQSKEAQEEAFNEDGRIDIVDAMNQLYKFCWGAKRVWSHGASFDVVICEHIFKKIGKAVPWNFWQVRCTRTLFDIGINPQRPPVLKHHALEDAWNQAVGVQNVYKTLMCSTTSDGSYIRPFAKEK